MSSFSISSGVSPESLANSESVLSRFSEQNLRNPALTSVQSIVDGMVGGFAEQACDWRSLAAMAGGSLFYRVGRIGTLAFASRAPQIAPLLNVASYGIGLGAEVTAFEGTSRLLTSLTETQTPTNLWRWNGTGGIAQGLLSSFITFGMLKGVGRLSQDQNVILQHLFSDLGMVGGHQLAASVGVLERPEGDLAEQLLHAEITNLQMGAGISLLHHALPGLAALERSLHLTAMQMERSAPRISSRTQTAPSGESLFPSLSSREVARSLRRVGPLLTGLSVFSYESLAGAATRFHEALPHGSSWGLTAGLLTLGLGVVLAGGRRARPAGIETRARDFLQRFQLGRHYFENETPQELRELLSNPAFPEGVRNELHASLLEKFSEKDFAPGFYFTLEEMTLEMMRSGRCTDEQVRGLWQGMLERSPYLEKLGTQFDHPALTDIERQRLLFHLDRRLGQISEEEPHPNTILKIDPQTGSLSRIFKITGDIFTSEHLTPAQRSRLIQGVSAHLYDDNAVEVAGRMLVSPTLSDTERHSLYQRLKQRAQVSSTLNVNHIWNVDAAFAALRDFFATRLLPETEHRKIYNTLDFLRNPLPKEGEPREMALATRVGWVSLLLESPYLQAQEKERVLGFLRASMGSESETVSYLAYKIAPRVRDTAHQRALWEDLIGRLENREKTLSSNDFHLALRIFDSFCLSPEEQRRVLLSFQDEHGLREDPHRENTNLYYNLKDLPIGTLDPTAREPFLQLALNSMRDFRQPLDPRRPTEAEAMRWNKRQQGQSMACAFLQDSRLTPQEREALFHGVLEFVGRDPEVAVTNLTNHHLAGLLKSEGITPVQARQLWRRLQSLWNHSYSYTRDASVEIGAMIYDEPFLNEPARRKIFNEVYRRVYKEVDFTILGAAGLLLHSRRLGLQDQRALLRRIESLLTHWYDVPTVQRGVLEAAHILFPLRVFYLNPFAPDRFLEFMAFVGKSAHLPAHLQEDLQYWMREFVKYPSAQLAPFLAGLFTERANTFRRNDFTQGRNARWQATPGGLGYNFFFDLTLRHPQWVGRFPSLLAEALPLFFRNYEDKTTAVRVMEEALSRVSFPTVEEARRVWESLETNLSEDPAYAAIRLRLALALRRNISRREDRERLRNLAGTPLPNQAQIYDAQSRYRQLWSELNRAARPRENTPQ